jgi:hypothetical protein
LRCERFKAAGISGQFQDEDRIVLSMTKSSSANRVSNGVNALGFQILETNCESG